MRGADPKGARPIGQAWLRRELGLRVPASGHESYLAAGGRRTEVLGAKVVEHYPRRYAPDDTIPSHLRFALRHEPLDLGLMAAAMKRIDPALLEGWNRREPTGAFARRAWFFYEVLTGRSLDVPDARMGNYVDALDPGKQFVADRRNSPRHRVADNLLGDRALCPTVRRTARLDAYVAARIEREARELVARYDPTTLNRAVSYLYTKETRSSFALEGETPSPARTERFVAALRGAPAFDPIDPAELYRYFDATAQAEYLYERVIDTVRHDLKEELGFVATYDRALAAVRDIVDMPDRRASLFVRLCLQNGGRLAKSRRPAFEELTETEVTAMEAAVQAAVVASVGRDGT